VQAKHTSNNQKSVCKPCNERWKKSLAYQIVSILYLQQSELCVDWVVCVVVALGQLVQVVPAA
jgi:hypothetical protein